MRRDNDKMTPWKELRLVTVRHATSSPAAMTGSEFPRRFECVFRLPIGWHEYPAQLLEA